ncbi:MAG: tetratricopeptide repeat protein, partial [Acidobacteriaceae bacterium]|nr:tetratricopeptide repeat protein [Acidobacteriaceae bacterium]
MIKTLSPMGPNYSQSTRVYPDPDRLDSWKEIANYLRREVRTVQLWEKNEGLPVHRHFHKRLGSVFALRSEVESWKLQVSRIAGSPEPESAKLPTPGACPENRITIYVLPLENAGDIERQCLCDAVVANTISALEQLNPGQVGIVIPKDAMQWEQCESPARIADSESLNYLLRWNLEDDGKDVRVNVALRFADTNVAAWSHTYRYRPSEFEELPTNVADQIFHCVWLKLFASSKSLQSGSRHEKPGSREAYLKGRYFWNQRNEEGLRKAISCFESAIKEDPQYALAYSGLADSLTLLSFYEIVSPFEAMPSARRAALKAIELDPNLAEAHASFADVLLHFDRDWQAADREYRRSSQCNPEYALGYHWYAN